MTQEEIESLADAYGLDMGETWEFSAKTLSEFAQAIIAKVAPTPCGACDGSGQVETGWQERPYTSCRSCLGSGEANAT